MEVQAMPQTPPQARLQATLPATSEAMPEVSANAKAAKPSPTATEKVALRMSIKNVEFTKLDKASKESLVAECTQTIAEQTNVPKSSVSVTLSPGSVVIDAQILVPEGQSVSSVQTASQKGNISGK